ncbi:2,3-diketo-L-gulonate TRAP transporter small permease protein YiaM [Pelagimonas phthalicica]|uniref:TRAP transporter small permease protein n=1 Tax=Pelagimonas phthalicica TaxID=1037362 RepID=A0A238JDN0_9RHOB|nr:TRAP transporter small permease [Pelagimonas phthalicica]TDS91444.1 C4-dicarboxylate transporter DctQ subunit [Pelagimonas phthalicica]SMX28493.1 2,3-diketo-L-gulonate TRAP transporter small permease protein YiaM [Pelagimonas phthalicica]
MSEKSPNTSLIGGFIDELEETFIAIILGAMTLITFVNVIVRYVFNSSWWRSFEGVIGIEMPRSMISALELTSFLFAWLVLFGISYAVKKTANLGVDVVLNMVSPTARRVLGLTAAAICVAYAFLLLKGSWDYWAPFAGFDATSGRWFPTGFANSRDQAWYEVGDIIMPDWLRFIEPIFNQGEAYEKIPRFIPYVILPVGAALLLYRFLQATWKIWTGAEDSLIVSHEAEDAVDDVAHLNKED